VPALFGLSEMEPRLRGFIEGFLLAQPFYGWVAGSHKTLARFSGLTPMAGYAR
jgi:hypothetical protein